MFWLLITFIIACAGALICYRLKIAGGVIVGAMFSVAIFNIFTGLAHFPVYAKIFAQIVSGAFIGVGINRNNIIQLKQVIKPAMALVSGMMVINLIIGLLIYSLSPLDLITSLFSAVPGGVTDMSIISHDMGADTSKVAVLQLIRLVSTLALFPTIIRKVSQYLPNTCNNYDMSSSKINSKEESTKQLSKNNVANNVMNNEANNRVKKILYTLAMALVAGTIGSAIGIPAGALGFSILGVSSFNVFTGQAYLPLPIKRFAQIIAGAFIGTSFTRDDLAQFRLLVFPAITLVIGYIILCTLLGIAISRIFKLDIRTSLFSSTPAGASDMALIASDLGANGPKVALLQIARLVSVIAFFPWIIQFIVFLIGK